MVTAAQAQQAVLAVGDAASVAASERELLSSVAGIVRGQVPYAAAAWLLTDPTTGLFTDGVVQHLNEEARLLELVAPETTRGLRRLAARRTAWCNEGLEGPGLLMVQPDDTVEPVTPAGAAWLELLLPDDTGPKSRTAIRTMAQVVRSAAAGGRYRADTRLRLRAANDRWVTLYAEPTLAGDGVAVVVEPSRSHDVAVVLSRAYGLTEREQEVVLAVARGDATAEIAGQLFVSIHTVRDHVKSALAKVGVGSRSELVATLFDRLRDDALWADQGGVTAWPHTGRPGITGPGRSAPADGPTAPAAAGAARHDRKTHR